MKNVCLISIMIIALICLAATILCIFFITDKELLLQISTGINGAFAIVGMISILGLEYGDDD